MLEFCRPHVKARIGSGQVRVYSAKACFTFENNVLKNISTKYDIAHEQLVPRSQLPHDVRRDQKMFMVTVPSTRGATGRTQRITRPFQVKSATRPRGIEKNLFMSQV